MTRVAFIIDGFTEKRILQRLCGDVKIARLNVNGRDVKIASIARRVDTILKVFGNRYYPVFVVFDREGRRETAEEVRLGLIRLLEELGHGGQVRVGVPDRMIENWMLADYKNVEKYYKVKGDGTRRSHEGKNGKSEMRKLAGTGSGYDGVVHGVETFCGGSPTVMARNSQSFRSFAEELRGECGWFR